MAVTDFEDDWALNGQPMNVRPVAVGTRRQGMEPVKQRGATKKPSMGPNLKRELGIKPPSSARDAPPKLLASPDAREKPFSPGSQADKNFPATSATEIEAMIKTQGLPNAPEAQQGPPGMSALEIGLKLGSVLGTALAGTRRRQNKFLAAIGGLAGVGGEIVGEGRKRQITEQDEARKFGQAKEIARLSHPAKPEWYDTAKLPELVAKMGWGKLRVPMKAKLNPAEWDLYEQTYGPDHVGTEERRLSGQLENWESLGISREEAAKLNKLKFEQPSAYQAMMDKQRRNDSTWREDLARIGASQKDRALGQGDTRLDQGERRLDQGDTRLDQGERRLDLMAEMNRARQELMGHQATLTQARTALTRTRDHLLNNPGAKGLTQKDVIQLQQQGQNYHRLAVQTREKMIGARLKQEPGYLNFLGQPDPDWAAQNPKRQAEITAEVDEEINPNGFLQRIQNLTPGMGGAAPAGAVTTTTPPPGAAVTQPVRPGALPPGNVVTPPGNVPPPPARPLSRLGAPPGRQGPPTQLAVSAGNRTPVALGAPGGQQGPGPDMAANGGNQNPYAQYLHELSGGNPKSMGTWDRMVQAHPALGKLNKNQLMEIRVGLGSVQEDRLAKSRSLAGQKADPAWLQQAFDNTFPDIFAATMALIAKAIAAGRPDSLPPEILAILPADMQPKKQPVTGVNLPGGKVYYKPLSEDNYYNRKPPQWRPPSKAPRGGVMTPPIPPPLGVSPWH